MKVKLNTSICVFGFFEAQKNIYPLNNENYIEYDGIYSILALPEFEGIEFMGMYRYFIKYYDIDNDTIVVSTSSNYNPISVAIPFRRIEPQLLKFNLIIPISPTL